MSIILKLLLFSALIFFNFACFAQNGQDPLTSEDREALSQWGNRRANIGNLLTPPKGKISIEVQESQNFIATLVQQLIENQPELFKLNLVVNIYGSETPNAFASQVSATQGLEGQWLSEHGGAWPLRKLLGIKNGEPIYEVGVTTGLLRLIDTVDELAFVLGHELSHISEGHTTSNGTTVSDYVKRWWNTQPNEVTADQLGLEKIAGKYNLDDAVMILEKLLMSSDPSALSAAVSTHHDEGERISLLQAKIMDLKREKLSNQIRTSQVFPSKYKLSLSGRSDGYSSKYQNWSQRHFQEFFADVLSNEVKPWLWSMAHWANGPDYIKEFRMISAWNSPNKEQRAETFWKILGAIQNSNSSSQLKVDAIFKAINILFEGNYRNIFWKTLGKDRAIFLTRFLWENASGAQPWTYEKSFQSMMNNRVEEGAYYRNNGDLFLYSSEGQSILFKLAQTNVNWQKMLIKLPQLMFVGGEKNERNFSIWTYWIKKISTASRPTEFDQKLATAFSLTAPKIINQLDEPDLLSSDLVDLFNEVQELSKTQPQNLSLLNIFAGIRRDIQTKTVAILKNEFSDFKPQKAQGKVDLLASVDALSPLTDSELQEYLPALLKMIDVQLNTYWPMSVMNASQCPEKVKHLLERILSFNTLAFEQKFQLLKYAGALEITPKPGENFTSLLTKEDVFRFLETPVLSIVQTAARTSEPKTSVELNELLRLRLSYLSSTMGIFDFLSDNNEIFDRFIKELRLVDIRKIVGILYKLRRDFIEMSKEPKGLHYDVNLASLDSKSGRLLLEALVLHKSESPDFESWYTLLEQISHLSLGVLDSRAGYRNQVEKILIEDLAKRNPEQKRRLLNRRFVRENLTNDTFAEQLFEVIKSDKTFAGQPEKIKIQLTDWESKWELSSKYPDAYKTLKNLIARHYSVQPFAEMEIFPESKKSLTEKTTALTAYLRGLGGLAAELRKHNYSEQIEFIEYIMGRRQEIPAFIEKVFKEENNETKKLFAKAGVSNLRRRLQTETVMNRTLVVNSLLAGPNSMIGKPDGQAFLIDHLLKDFRSENREIAKALATALIESRGKMKSLGFAFIYGQYATKKSDQISKEATILNSLFNAYGVPGIKFGQYLGFTDGLKEYQDAFESLQDSAMPLSYLEMLELIEAQFETQWNKKWVVKRILGTGSVNVAIEIINLENQATEVIVLSRKNIETVTQDDFYNFNKFLQALTKTKVNKDKFGFLLGLSNIIQRSVELEFNKQHAFEIQKNVQNLYNRTIDGWKVQTVDAFEVGASYIRMEKGLGVGARKVKEADPTTYRAAMKALSRLEMDVLTGMDQSENPNPIPLIANPDFHDGQVLIDVAHKSVTILDFGQAVVISNTDRNLSIEILAIINGLTSKQRAKDFLEEFSKNAYRKSVKLSDEEINQMFKSSDPMDIFIQMISLTSRHGVDMPLSSIHWILGINRQIKLGNKINLPIEKYVRNLLLAEKLGGSLKNYNQLKLVVRKIGQFWNPSQLDGKKAQALFCKDILM